MRKTVVIIILLLEGSGRVDAFVWSMTKFVGHSCFEILNDKYKLNIFVVSQNLFLVVNLSSCVINFHNSFYTVFTLFMVNNVLFLFQ